MSNVGELTDLVAKEFSGVGGSMGALCYVLVEAVGRAATTDGTSFYGGTPRTSWLLPKTRGH